MTFQQHMKKQRDWEEKQVQKRSRPEGEHPGRCTECDKADFELRVKKGILYRTCKNCGDVKEF